jgi:2-polyprenyl-3-methyl-5-hydroxy-6-metoxy-1,4-benzoquinol methylase
LGVVSESDRTEYSLIVREIADYVSLEQSDCIEIGAGDGVFLDILQGNRVKTAFYDLSNDVTTKLSRKHRVHKEGERYDVIVFRHILEHILDPFEFLREQICLLGKTTCYVHIEVPSYEVLDNHADPFLSEHIHQFSLLSLSFF